MWTLTDRHHPNDPPFCLCVTILQGLMFGLKGPALLAMADQLQRATGSSPLDDAARDAALTSVGAANGAASLGLMMGSLLMGSVVDWVTHWHRCLSVAWLCSGVCFSGFALFTTPSQLWAVSFVHGATIGTLAPCFNIGTMRTWGDECGPYMQALHASFGVGMFLSPIAVGLELNAASSFHATVAAICVMVCCGAAAPLCLPTPQLETQGALASAAAAASVGKGTAAAGAAAAARAEEEESHLLGDTDADADTDSSESSSSNNGVSGGGGNSSVYKQCDNSDDAEGARAGRRRRERTER
jgi:uncharacterized membrane protein YgcG